MEHSFTASNDDSAQHGEDLSANSIDGRIAALQEGQRILEQQMSLQFQSIRDLLSAQSSQPKPEVSFHQDTGTSETPAKFDRRNSMDTRASLNEARKFTQSATKLPRTAPGKQSNQQSDADMNSDRASSFTSMTIQHPEQFTLSSPLAKITVQNVRSHTQRSRKCHSKEGNTLSSSISLLFWTVLKMQLGAIIERRSVQRPTVLSTYTTEYET